MSSMYPAWWSDTLTVFNKFVDPQTGIVRWYRTVLSRCFWQNQFQRLKVGQVEVKTDYVVCRIPVQNNYLSKFEWVNKPNDTMGNYFTLDNGDIVIKGNVLDEIDEYTSGKRSTDLINKYKFYGCIVIDKFNDNTGPGRGIPHYHIEGV